ncbi:MAG: hypothetical protein EOO87_09650 [Pedobacter sp.]|nr:MAG: hypothetical protein EOO87_09650 [Pedobacter sp.]
MNPKDTPVHKKELSLTAKRIIVITVAVIFVLSIKACIKESPGQSKSRMESKKEREAKNMVTKAFVYSKNCVREKLISPITAKFPYVNGSAVTKINDSTFTVSSHVDSQNSFGAMIRRNYKCKIIITAKDIYRCEDLTIEE